MDSIYISSATNALLVVAFIIDRIFRLKSINEFKLAKEAQIDNLKQQLEIERKNNDIEITEMHKKRYESLKVILEEQERENDKNKEVLLELQLSLQNAAKDIESRKDLADKLLTELNRLALNKKTLEIEKQALQNELEQSRKYPGYQPLRERV